MDKVKKQFEPLKELKKNRSNNNENDQDGYFKYIIAATVLGMCIGNMFVMRRYKGILKMNVENYSKTATNNNNNAQNNKYKTNNNNQYYSHYKSKDEWEKAESEADERFRQRFKEYEYQQQQFHNTKESYEKRNRTVLPDNLKNAFLSLNLLPKVHSVSEIKEAYRLCALRYHPDRLSSNDPKRDELTKKFKEATISYKLLLDHFK